MIVFKFVHSDTFSIRDLNKSVFFTRLGLLGEGGFARVYEVKDMRSNRLAIKVVTKASLKTKKAKTKVIASPLLL